jgi:hypothetical protein
MNKNNQQPGKKLTREAMKKLMGGGAALLLPCDYDEDCPRSCLVVDLKGYYCIGGLCRYFKVCP